MANSLFDRFGSGQQPGNPMAMVMQIAQSSDPIQAATNLYNSGQMPKEQYDFIVNGLQTGPQQVMQNLMNNGTIPQIQNNPMASMAQMLMSRMPFNR